MSDVAQGPGWWIASDGKWYPPEQHPSAQAPPPPVQDYPSMQTNNPLLANRSGHDEFVGAMPASAAAAGVPAGAAPRMPGSLPAFYGGEEPLPTVPSAPPPAQPGPPPPINTPQTTTPRRISGGGGIPIGEILPVPPGTQMVGAPIPVPGVGDYTPGPAMVAQPGQGPQGAAGGVPAGGYGGGQVGPLSPYDEGLYSGSALRARKPKKHYPIWTILVIVIVVVAGGLIYWHIRQVDNPHKSASTIAFAYISAAQAHNKAAMQADAIPGQAAVEGQGIGLPTSALTFASGGTAPAGKDTDVTVLACANLYSGASCSRTIFGYKEGTMAVRKVNGAWYVDTANLPLCGPGEDLVCVLAP